MKMAAKSRLSCDHPGEKENNQEWKTGCRTAPRNPKRVKTFKSKKKRASQKRKELVSLIDQGKMSAREYEKILKILASTPDLRSEKVLSLKKALLQGQYQIKSQAVAEKILKEIIFELH